jgi:hypothetical protein
MDVTGELRRRADRMSQDPLPARWVSEPALADVASFGELLSRLRRLDPRSDAALRALARLVDEGETEAGLVVTAALLPLLIARCDRRPQLVGEAIAELAARVAEPAHEPAAPDVANRLLRRVVWRVHHGHGDHGWQVPAADPAGVVAAGDDVESEAVDRVALAEFRRRLAARPRGVEAWTVFVRSESATAGLSPAERKRLARRRLEVRRLAIATLVA